MKLRLFLWMVIFGAIGWFPVARAQQSGTPAPNSATTQDQTIRQTLIEKIEQLKYEKIKEKLELDDITAEKFFALYKPAEKDIQALVMERNAELKALGAATNVTNSDADIAALTAKIKDLNARIATREQTLDADLTPLLTPLQRAKLLVFEHEFDQRVREELAERNSTAAELRALRKQIRLQRIKNQLLKKEAAEKAAKH